MFKFPKTTTIREIQRNSKKIFEEVNATKEPIVVLKNNQPNVAIIDVAQLEEFEAIISAEKGYSEYLGGKAKKATSLADVARETFGAWKDNTLTDKELMDPLANSWSEPDNVFTN